MKTIITVTFLLILGTMSAQTMTIAETNAQIKKGDSLKNHGTVMLSEFMLMRDTALHTHALADFAAARIVYKNCIANGTVSDYDGGLTAMILDGDLMILDSYESLYDKNYRTQLMAETEKERSKTVKYNDKEYKVSKKTKERFEQLNPKK
jgi:hypothetical protein